jgi:hypothetical protein
VSCEQYRPVRRAALRAVCGVAPQPPQQVAAVIEQTALALAAAPRILPARSTLLIALFDAQQHHETQ